jgi:hypothetical protein
VPNCYLNSGKRWTVTVLRTSQTRWGQALPRTQSYPAFLKRRGAGGTDASSGTTARKELGRSHLAALTAFGFFSVMASCKKVAVTALRNS